MTTLLTSSLEALVLTGDGDFGAIILSHFVHAARRMTRGQVAPTAPKGTYTRMTPFGIWDILVYNIVMEALGVLVVFLLSH